MPEGPEIRLAADRVEKAVKGEIARDVTFGLPKLKSFGNKLKGRRVLSVGTYGKAMVTHFEHGLSVYTHNQLYGRWMVRKAGTLPKTNRQLRFAIHGPTHSALLYSASTIEVLPTSEVDRHPFIAKLGPDPLHAKTSAKTLATFIKRKRSSRRVLASALLDQSFIAGIGNYLRSEILFFSGLLPSRTLISLDDDEVLLLAKTALDLTLQSYKHAGVTNDLHLAKELKDAGVKRRQYRHAVFGRGGDPCYFCEAPIVLSNAGGRRCYLCESCQR